MNGKKFVMNGKNNCRVFAILSAFICQTNSFLVWHGFRKLFIACIKQNYYI